MQGVSGKEGIAPSPPTPFRDSLYTLHSLIHLQALEKDTQNKEAKAVPLHLICVI